MTGIEEDTMILSEYVYYSELFNELIVFEIKDDNYAAVAFKNSRTLEKCWGGEFTETNSKVDLRSLA